MISESAANGYQMVETPGVNLAAGQVTFGLWAMLRPGSASRNLFMSGQVYGTPNNHAIVLAFDPVAGTLDSSSMGSSIISASGVYRDPSGWAFGWMQATTSYPIGNLQLMIYQPPSTYEYAGSTANGFYLWRPFLASGFVSVPDLT